MSKFLGLFVFVSVMAIGAGTAQSDHRSHHDDHDLPLYLSRTVDPTAQDSTAPGNLWVGTGIPAGNFLLQENLDKGVELAIKAHLRQGGDIPPTYVDDDGRVHVVVPSGAQPGNPNRAAWNFTFSVNTSLPGAKPSLEDYEAELWIDLDPSRKDKSLKLELAKLGPPAGAPAQQNGYGWKDGSTVVIGDDEGTSRVTQNSQNLAFYASVIDANPDQPGIQPYTFGPGEFEVVLKIRTKRGHHWAHNTKGGHHGGWDDNRRELARIHVVFDVVDP